MLLPAPSGAPSSRSAPMPGPLLVEKVKTASTTSRPATSALRGVSAASSIRKSAAPASAARASNSGTSVSAPLTVENCQDEAEDVAPVTVAGEQLRQGTRGDARNAAPNAPIHSLAISPAAGLSLSSMFSAFPVW